MLMRTTYETTLALLHAMLQPLDTLVLLAARPRPDWRHSAPKPQRQGALVTIYMGRSNPIFTRFITT